MLKKLLLPVTLGLTFYGASADVLNPEQALERALDGGQSNVKGLKATADRTLAMTVKDNKTQEAAAYIFTNGSQRGFLVVSASDLVAPVLGYSDINVFSKEQMPPAFEEWMQGYAREISDIESGKRRVLAKQVRRGASDRPSVTPMVQTKWNQSEPYNDLCPVINGRRSVTGCLATAEAQVLKYFDYPEKLKGSVSYTTSTYKQSVKIDFDTLSLDWHDMENVYDKNSSETAKMAVAKLMLACGAASIMDYSPTASGASSANGIQGMYDYFSCLDAGLILGSWLALDDLEEYIYNYLTTKGPLLYCGQSQSAGHAFVCDGYSSGGFFHFNWGWGGMSDGYFRLNALNPGSQGIGGSTSGYNANQQLVPGLHAPVERNKFVPILAADGGSCIPDYWNTVLGDTVMFESCMENGGFYNFSADTLKVTYGARITRNATGENMYVPSYGIQDYPLTFLRGWRGYPFIIPEQMEEGTYTIVPAYKNADSDWSDFYQEQAYQNSVLATVVGDSIKFEAPKPADIFVSNVAFDTPLYAGGGFVLQGDVVATGDRKFYGNVALVLGEYYGEDFVSDFQASSVTLSAVVGEPSRFTYTGEFTNTRLKGEYQMIFVNTETGVIVSDPVTVKINPYAGVAIPEVVKAEIENATAVDPYNVTVKAEILSKGGFYSRPLYLSLGTLKGETFEVLNQIASPVYYIEPNQTANISFSGAIAGQVGEAFIARLEYYDSKTRKYIQIGEDMPFVIGESDVESIEVDETVDSIRIFDLNGREINADNLEKGVYLRKNGTKVTKMIIR